MKQSIPVKTVLSYGGIAGGVAVAASLAAKATTPIGTNDSSWTVPLTLVILVSLFCASYLAASRTTARALTTGGLTALVTALCGVLASASTGALFRGNSVVTAISRTLALTSIGLIAGYVAYRRAARKAENVEAGDEQPAPANSNRRDLRK